MEYFTVNDTDLKSSRIGLGTRAMDGGGTDETESIRTIHAALEKGIDLIEPEPVYGFGHSEKSAAEWIDNTGR